MAEKEDRESKRFRNTQNIPETRNISSSKIKDVHLKAPYKINAKNIYPNMKT